MKKITIDNKTGRTRVQTINDGKPDFNPKTKESMKATQQQFKDLVDINVIMAKYHKTGELPADQRQMIFADVSEITDYHSSVNKVLAAQEAFMLLDPTIRNRFQNDPGELLKFIQDPSNFEEAVKLGIFNKPESPPANPPKADPPAAPAPDKTVITKP